MPTVIIQTNQTIPLHQQRERFEDCCAAVVKPGKLVYPCFWSPDKLLGIGEGVEPASCIASRAIAAARRVVTISTIHRLP